MLIRLAPGFEDTTTEDFS